MSPGLDHAALAEKLEAAPADAAPEEEVPEEAEKAKDTAPIPVLEPDPDAGFMPATAPEVPIPAVEPEVEVEEEGDAGERPVSDLAALDGGTGEKGNRAFRTTMLTAASRTPGLSDRAVRLLTYLAHYGDADGGNIFPSTARAMRETGMSEGRFRRALDELRRSGWVESISFRGRTGKTIPNLQRLRIPEDLPDGITTRRGAEGALRFDRRPPDQRPVAEEK